MKTANIWKGLTREKPRHGTSLAVHAMRKGSQALCTHSQAPVVWCSNHHTAFTVLEGMWAMDTRVDLWRMSM